MVGVALTLVAFALLGLTLLGMASTVWIAHYTVRMYARGEEKDARGGVALMFASIITTLIWFGLFLLVRSQS